MSSKDKELELDDERDDNDRGGVLRALMVALAGGSAIAGVVMFVHGSLRFEPVPYVIAPSLPP